MIRVIHFYVTADQEYKRIDFLNTGVYKPLSIRKVAALGIIAQFMAKWR